MNKIKIKANNNLKNKKNIIRQINKKKNPRIYLIFYTGELLKKFF